MALMLPCELVLILCVSTTDLECLLRIIQQATFRVATNLENPEKSANFNETCQGNLQQNSISQGILLSEIKVKYPNFEVREVHIVWKVATLKTYTYISSQALPY